LAGSVGADLIKVGTASLLGAIGGILWTGGTAFIAATSIGFAIGISVGVGIAFELVDRRYRLTEKLIAFMEELPIEAKKVATTVGQGFWNTLKSGGLGMGNWVYKRY
jgi:hypothetical protein